mmetsp:Transcript_20268/g.30480  ORF Transcript_20268/g.30480 Transcript_20268/m.30480 type:complete len:381 (-) Transcript_20268:39-1181(-)
MSSKSGDNDESEESGEPRPNDVLLGRASRISNHPGNIRYRYLINSNQRNYHACKTRLDKMIFIRQLTKDLLDDGRVKFWKRETGGKWRAVDFRTVQDKVSHALRDSKGCNEQDSALMMMEYGKAPNTTTVAAHSSVISPLDAALNQNRSVAGLQHLQRMKQQQDAHAEAQRLVPQMSSPLMSQVNIGLDPNLRAKMQYLQELKQQNEREQIELMEAALQERRRNSQLASVASELRTVNQPFRPLLGGLPQYTLQTRPNSNQLSDPSPLFLDSIINQSSAQGQLSSNDLLLNRTRGQHQSSPALGQLITAPPSIAASLSGNNTAPYQNQPVHAGTHRLEKNLSSPGYLIARQEEQRESALRKSVEELKLMEAMARLRNSKK